MLVNVGSRLGVGPVMLRKLSSQLTHTRPAIAHTVNREKRVIDLLLAWHGRRARLSFLYARYRNIQNTGSGTRRRQSRRTRSLWAHRPVWRAGPLSSL